MLYNNLVTTKEPTMRHMPCMEHELYDDIWMWRKNLDNNSISLSLSEDQNRREWRLRNKDVEDMNLTHLNEAALGEISTRLTTYSQCIPCNARLRGDFNIINQDVEYTIEY